MAALTFGVVRPACTKPFAERNSVLRLAAFDASPEAAFRESVGRWNILADSFALVEAIGLWFRPLSAG